MVLGQKLLGATRLALKPESAIGARVILVIVGLAFPAGKAWTTPCFPRSRASPGPLSISSAKIWVTKTVSSATPAASPSFVIAMAVGLPPTFTFPTTVREPVLMMDTVPSVWLAT